MQGKRIIYAMLCLLLLLGALQAFAQEETETPLPPPTEPLATVPSATFTPLPTNTASATMTATATETSSPTNTLTATNTLVVPSETPTTTFTPVASTETLMPIDTATTTFTPVASTETQTATAPAEVTDSVEIATTATVDSNAYAIRGLESNASPSVSQFGDTPSTNQINQTMYYLTDFETTALSPPTVRIDNVSLSNTTLIVAVPSSFPPEYGGFSARTSLPALQTSQLSVTVNLNEAHTIFGINNYNYSFPLIPSAMVQHYYTYNDANGNIITQSSICDDGYNLNNCRPIMPFGVPNVWSITVHLDYIDATHPNPSSTFLDNISFTASVDVTPPTATPISCTASSFAQVQGSAPQSSDGDDSCPNPTATPAPLPSCLGQIIPNASPDVNLRQYPNISNWVPIIATLEAGTTLNLIAKTTVEGSLWWHASVTAFPELEGYIFGTLVYDLNDCELQVDDEDPPLPPQPQANETCTIELIGDVSIFDGSGAILRTELAGTQLQIFGMSRNRQRYLISQPGLVLPQQWLNASLGRAVLGSERGCNNNTLGRFRETTDQNYWNAVGFYANNFQAPINPSLFISSYPTFRNSYFYDGNLHEGTDITYRPPDGKGNAMSFDVYTMASGIVVDAGPDGITRAYRYQRDYCPAIEPPPNLFEGIAGVFYITSSITCPDQSGGFRVQYYFAMMFDQDGDDDNNNTEEPSTGTYAFGLTMSQVTTILVPQQFTLDSSCNSIYGCIQGAGRRLIIWHDSGDIDLPSNFPELQTVYYHVDIDASLYSTWNNQCSSVNRLGTWIETSITNNPDYSVCQVNTGLLVGQAKLIGFTTGLHLHQEIHIDRNNDGIFANDGEDEDPLMAFQTIR